MALRTTRSALRAITTGQRAFHRATPALSGGLSQHQNTEDNTLETPFDFSVENYEKVNKILGRYPANYKQSAIIPLLDLAQRQNGGWLPLAAMNKVAEVVDQAPIRVYEVASFYTMFNRVKVGKYFIQLCGTTPCMACGAEEIATTIQEHLNIKDGETTEDGLFTLKEVECLGACSNAPMVQMNDDFYENLTPETTRQLLDACARGEKPAMTKWGSLPMNGQLSCEGPLGNKHALVDGPPEIGGGKDTRFRKDGVLDGVQVEPASVKEHMMY